MLDRRSTVVLPESLLGLRRLDRLAVFGFCRFPDGA
jgi:hypothetical protein